MKHRCYVTALFLAIPIKRGKKLQDKPLKKEIL